MCLPKDANNWAILDLGGFEQTLMLTALNKGINSIPAYNLVKYPDILRRYIDIPSSYAIAIGISLGYAADNKINTFKASRMPLANYLEYIE